LLDRLEDADQFGLDLANAIEFLSKYSWEQNDVPLTPHGRLGSDFSYPINSEFLLITHRKTDRTGEGKPLLFHFFLETIEQIKT
jgi:hypothetical protein